MAIAPATPAWSPTTGAPGARGATPAPLWRGLTVSTLLHAAAIAAALYVGTQEPPPRPPVYKVNLVGAPPGEKAIGVVDRRPAPQQTANAQAPSGVQTPPPKEVAPTTSERIEAPPPKATPTPTRTREAGTEDGTAKAAASNAPRAGSESGDKGADVATIRTEGIAFPAQGYLDNIVRQIELRFRPDPRYNAMSLRTEVSFLIHRDGHVSELRIMQSSGQYRFDLDARAAIEAAGTADAFGPLPAAWPDDVLRVYFNFTPKGMR